MTYKKLSDTIDQCIVRSLQKRYDNASSLYTLAKSWKYIVGCHIANMVIVQNFCKNGQIILKLKHPGFALEVNAYKNIIQDRINTHLGAVFQVLITN